MGSRGNQTLNTAYRGQTTVQAHIGAGTTEREDMIKLLNNNLINSKTPRAGFENQLNRNFNQIKKHKTKVDFFSDD